VVEDRDVMLEHGPDLDLLLVGEVARRKMMRPGMSTSLSVTNAIASLTLGRFRADRGAKSLIRRAVHELRGGKYTNNVDEKQEDKRYLSSPTC
jgi:hypothetical protein